MQQGEWYVVRYADQAMSSTIPGPERLTVRGMDGCYRDAVSGGHHAGLERDDSRGCDDVSILVEVWGVAVRERVLAIVWIVVVRHCEQYVVTRPVGRDGAVEAVMTVVVEANREILVLSGPEGRSVSDNLEVSGALGVVTTILVGFCDVVNDYEPTLGKFRFVNEDDAVMMCLLITELYLGLVPVGKCRAHTSDAHRAESTESFESGPTVDVV